MSDPTSQKPAGYQSDDARNVDPVLKLARARNQALTLWSEAQAAKTSSAPSPKAYDHPSPKETGCYTGPYQRSTHLLDRIIEIEDQLYDTVATTPAGLMFQAELLRDAVFPADHEGRRLLTSIISGIEAMSIHGGSGNTNGDRWAPQAPQPLGSSRSFGRGQQSDAVGNAGVTLSTTTEDQRAQAASSGAL